uniref:anthocyanidin 3-O-glucosyltransferase n=1 Tax=Salix viminalis TaxID=40686 RepID=A0A6N2L827_SALVM
MDIDSDMRSVNVVKLVKELMEGERGKKMKKKTTVMEKPHVICFPSPAQSHIKSMLKLAKLLYCKGFHVTLVNTEFNHRRLLKSRGSDSLKGLPDFRFESIPDGLPPSDENVTQDLPRLCEAATNNFLAPFNDLLDKLNGTASPDVPPVTCIVSDGFMPVAITAAEMLGIPIAVFFTISACSLMGLKQFKVLKEKGLTPLKDDSYLTNGYLDRVVDWIPGMKDIRLRDLPSFFRTTDPNDCLFTFCMESVERALSASAIIFHTFDALEQEVLTSLYSMFPRVYTIGPLQLLLNEIQEDDLYSIDCNLWKEEVECLQWLDSQRPNSVIYVNFGSIAVATKEQLIEFGMGLSKTGHPFLWIIRPDMIAGDCAVLPPEFTEETKDRGFISSWCPQEEVLNHPSVGGFLTHCGWGSTIESISSGVPMLCWPSFGDQQTNCWYTCTECGIGMEIDSIVTREKVETKVRELLDGEEGKKMKQKAMEWKRVALEATRPSGSSTMNLDKLVQEVLLSRNHTCDKRLVGLNIVKLARKIVREKEKEMGSISKPHVVVIPSPVQGHIKTMLKFAKLLHYKGLHITFVNTEFNHNRLLRSGGLHAVDDLPGFHFDTIPDGLPPSDIDATQDIPSLCDAMNKKFLAPFTDLLLKLKNTVSENNPPITCVVADPFAPFSIKAGEEVGLPVVMYATVNACGYMGCKQLYALREKGFTPIKDLSNLSNGYLETKVDCAPGMKDVRLKDFPFIQTTDPDDVVFNFIMGAAETSIKARAIALHTFDALEPEVLDGLSTIFPRVYSIGPLQLLLNQIEENGLKSIGYNLWKEDRSCLQWLDTKEPKSVVYVNFGSITVMTAAQLVEFAMGLANSKISFLWIIRPDLVTGESAVLPAEFAETENRSFITSWCPQEEVLNHPAVGGFLTHSGWGSTIESLCAGVPMVCWPFFADQAMNCRYSCNEWGVGMEIDNNVKREGVEMLVKELMEGDEGEKMREKAMEWKRLAEEAAGPKGTSSINLDKFIHEIISSNN